MKRGRPSKKTTQNLAADAYKELDACQARSCTAVRGRKDDLTAAIRREMRPFSVGVVPREQQQQIIKKVAKLTLKEMPVLKDLARCSAVNCGLQLHTAMQAGVAATCTFNTPSGRCDKATREKMMRAAADVKKNNASTVNAYKRFVGMVPP